MPKVLFILMALLLCSCGEDGEQLLETPSSEEIVVTSDYPAVVMVVMPGGAGLCSGTFISPRAVLTAAHCTLDSGSYTVYTSFGRFSTSTVERLGVGTVEDENDISLLIFDRDVASVEEGQVIALDEKLTRLQKVRLVGFGCTNLSTKLGAGVKRTGTNQIYQVNDYVELITPSTSVRGISTRLTFGEAPPEVTRGIASATRSIIGPENRAATCFGDSGGPLLSMSGDALKVVGVTHAGGYRGSSIVSQFANMIRDDNYEFLNEMDDRYSLGISGLCKSGLPSPGYSCGEMSAGMQVFAFLKSIWTTFLTFLSAR